MTQKVVSLRYYFPVYYDKIKIMYKLLKLRSLISVNTLLLMKVMTLICCLDLSINAYCEEQTIKQKDERQKLEILPFEFKTGELNEIEIENIYSTIIRISAKQQVYSLLFKDKNNELKASYKQLKVIISSKVSKPPKLKTYLVQGIIIDSKTGQIIKKIVSRNIKRTKMLKEVELTLEILFNLKKIQEDKHKEIKEIKKKKQRLKKANSKKSNKNSINFKKRILTIKNDIPSKLEKAKKVEALKKSNAANIREEKKKEQKEKERLSALADKKALQAQNKQSKRKLSKNWFYTYDANADYRVYSLNVEDDRAVSETVKITNRINYLKINLGVNFIHKSYKLIEILLRIQANVPFSDDAYDFVQANNYELGTLLHMTNWYTDFELSFKSDNIQFASLPVFGGSLQASNISFHSLKFSSMTLLSNFKIYIGTTIKTILFGSNLSKHEIDTDNLTGNSLSIDVKYKNPFYISNSWLKASIGSELLDNKTNIKVSGLFYSFGLYKKF